MLGFNSPALDLSFCFRLPYDLIFLEVIVESKVMSYLWQSCTHTQAALSTWDQKVFHKKCEVFVPAVVMASQISSSFFFCFLQWFLCWIHLFWNGGNRSCNPQLQYTSNSSIFSCCVMTFLCFLGILPAPLVALSGPHGVIYGLQYCTEKIWEGHERSLLLPEVHTFLERWTSHVERMNIAWSLAVLSSPPRQQVAAPKLLQGSRMDHS